MIGILPHVLQVIMLPPRSNALLRVDRSGEGGQFCAGRSSAEEDGFELIHARVGEEEGGVVEGRGGGGGDEGVRVLGLEVGDEGGSDSGGGPFCWRC